MKIYCEPKLFKTSKALYEDSSNHRHNKENPLIRKIAQLFSLFAAWGKTAVCSDRTFLLTSREGTMRKKYGTLILAKGGHRETSVFFRKTLRLLAFMADPKVDAKRQSF